MLGLGDYSKCACVGVYFIQVIVNREKKLIYIFPSQAGMSLLINLFYSVILASHIEIQKRPVPYLHSISLINTLCPGHLKHKAHFCTMFNTKLLRVP
jgi:hypothetical protein